MSGFESHNATRGTNAADGFRQHNTRDNTSAQGISDDTDISGVSIHTDPSGVSIHVPASGVSDHSGASGNLHHSGASGNSDHTNKPGIVDRIRDRMGTSGNSHHTDTHTSGNSHHTNVPGTLDRTNAFAASDNSTPYSATGGMHATDGLHQHDQHQHHHTGLPGTSHHTDTTGIHDRSGTPGITDRNTSHNAAGDTYTADKFRPREHDQHHHTGLPGTSHHTDTTGIHDRNTSHNAAGGMGVTDGLHQHEKHHAHHTVVPGMAHQTGASRIHDHSNLSKNLGRSQQCIDFLSTITGVEVVGEVKRATGKHYLINVITAGANSNTSGSTGSSFQIERTFKEFKELQTEAEYWSTKHGDQGCGYCPFFASADLPGMLSRMAASKDKIERELQDFLYSYIVNARRPRPTGMECEGYDNIPSILTRFLTKDLPPANTSAQPESMMAAEKNSVAHGAAGNHAMAHDVTGKHARTHGEVGGVEAMP